MRKRVQDRQICEKLSLRDKAQVWNEKVVLRDGAIDVRDDNQIFMVPDKDSGSSSNCARGREGEGDGVCSWLEIQGFLKAHNIVITKVTEVKGKRGGHTSWSDVRRSVFAYLVGLEGVGWACA